MISKSSLILSNITNFRNPNGTEQEWTKKAQRIPANTTHLLIAEAGYIAVIPFAMIETALSAIAKLFSVCLPMDQARHDAMTQWLDSSSFSVGWAFADATINLFCNDMIVTEKVARACAASGNIFVVPVEALNQ